MKRALIIGIKGQEGSHLAEFLLSKGYEVHGIIRFKSKVDLKERVKRIIDWHKANVLKVN